MNEPVFITDEARVKMLLDHLMECHNSFCEAHPEIEPMDDFMAVHNFHVVFILSLERDFKAVESLLQVGGKRVTHADLLALKTGEFYAALGPKVLKFPKVRARRTPDLAATPAIRFRRFDKLNTQQRSFVELSEPVEREG